MDTVWHGSASAILPVADLSRSVEFYRGIGFTVEVYSGGGYAFVDAGGIRFHLSESGGDDFDPFVAAAMIYLYVDDVDAAHARLSLDHAVSLTHDQLRERWSRRESLARMSPVRDEEWGVREFWFTDPDNNLVRVGTPQRRD